MAYFFFHIVVFAFSVYAYRFYSKYFESTPCSQDPRIELLDSSKSFDSCSLFSTDYFQARQKFRTAVAKYNSSSSSGHSVELWSSTILDDLTLDVAVLPGKTKELGTIVHSSGVHGIEGYAGSAIQLAVLDLVSKKETTVDRPTIVLVHAVNPVGMKEYRRCNEHNVDLNRNGLAIPGAKPSFQDFVNQRDPNIASYETFKDIFVPVMDIDRPGDDLSLYHRTIAYFVALFPALMKHGFPKLKKGIVAGKSKIVWSGFGRVFNCWVVRHSHTRQWFSLFLLFFFHFVSHHRPIPSSRGTELWWKRL